jgi:dihydrofolate reductase
MIAAIFSVDQSGGVGNKGTLPWAQHHPEDMAWFREHTNGHVVVMGRNTWDDPKMLHPLPGRINVIATTRSYPYHPDVTSIKGDLNKEILALQDRYPKKNIWIIGGANLLMQCKDITDYAYVTHRRGSYYSDTRLHMSNYFHGMQAKSSCPSKDKVLNFTVYKNISPFRPFI